MPLIYRHVVPNVPAWTADNGKLVYNSGGISRRRPLTITAALGGTLHITDQGVLGWLGTSDISLGNSVTQRINSREVDQYWDTVEWYRCTYGESGGLGDGMSHVCDTPSGTPVWGWEPRDLHPTMGLELRWDSAQIGLGTLPPYTDMGSRWNTDATRVYLEIRVHCKLGLEWSANRQQAQWYAELAKYHHSYPYWDPEYDSVFLLRQERYSTVSSNTREDIIAMEPSSLTYFESDEIFPRDPIRLGNSPRLRYAGIVSGPEERGLSLEDAYVDVTAVAA